MKSFQLLIVSILLIVNTATIAYCLDVKLSWEPSPTAEVAGYKIYYQDSDRNFPLDGVGAVEGPSPVDVGNEMTASLSGLMDDTIYYFSVTAYDENGNESSYSEIISNKWMLDLQTPANGAVNEPVPVFFEWEDAPVDYNVTYTLYYGTDENEVAAAGSLMSLPPQSDMNRFQPVGLIVLALILLGTGFIKTQARKRFLPQTLTLMLALLLGGMLTACDSGGGGGSSIVSDRSASDPTTNPTEIIVSVDTGNDNFYEVFEMEPGTTYYWKVIATDVNDAWQVYESETFRFTTENF